MTRKEKTNSKIASKKVLLTAAIAAVVASVILTGVFVVYPAISSVYAVQQQHSNTSATAIVSGNGQLPNITGSINVMQMTKNIIKDNLKVSFSQAADIAGKQITNATVVGGHLGVVQGYLVYTFFAVNPETHTAYHTIIDAGNGKVLYTSPGQQIRGGGGFFGTPGALGGAFGPHGLAGGFGHGPFGFGPSRAPGGFMGGGGMWH
jgi:uncharacterized membrane protein YkoI